MSEHQQQEGLRDNFEKQERRRKRESRREKKKGLMEGKEERA